MKKIILFFLLLLSFTPISFAVDITGGLDTNPTNTTTTPITTQARIEAGDIEAIFCGNHLLGRDEVRYVIPSENRAIIETFANTYGRDILRQNNLTAIQVSVTRHTGWEIYNELLQLCLRIREEGNEDARAIDNLYKQAAFFSRYYDTYPDNLKEGIMPGFLISLVDGVETLSFWLVWVALFNLVFWGTVYGIAKSENKVEYMRRIKQGFIYLVILWIIRAGIFGTMIAFLGYESLELFKIFFNF